jgi:Family of unknown function (DUF5996)
MNEATQTEQIWPVLDWEQWKDTAETLHMFTQIVGKTRLALTPLQNHWWNVPLYVTARGLSTSAMPLPDGGLLDIEFDFIAHELIFRRSSGRIESLPLKPQTVADFFDAYVGMLAALAVEIHIDRMPVELKDPIRFDQDTIHKSYDPDSVFRFWRALGHADRVFRRFSRSFYGKVSPVHFFWGSFDLAVTRFNGQRAPARIGVDSIQAEAYSHECISAGFWPGNGGFGQAAFYCYAAPVPPGLAEVGISGAGGFNKDLGEFLLNYDDARRSADPDKTVLEFLDNTYSAAADLAKWDRASLERNSP